MGWMGWWWCCGAAAGHPARFLERATSSFELSTARLAQGCLFRLTPNHSRLNYVVQSLCKKCTYGGIDGRSLSLRWK